MLSSIASPAVLTSYQDLLAASERLKPLLDTRRNLRPAGAAPAKRLILVCGGTGCHASESQRIVANFQELIEADGCSDDVHASISGCFGFCEKGPIVKIFPDDVFYVQVKPDDVPEIFDTHIHGNQRVRRLLYEQLTLPSGETVRPGLGKRIETQHAIPFYKKQQRIALRNCGLINPEDIDESIAAGGYQAFGKALTEMTPEQVIDVMKRSGLRGRGGAGFPTGRKWEFARGYVGDEKFVICNADEGDPGAFMDRSIMEGDSNSVIEGMAIAAYAIGSHQGYVYIRAEYPLAIQRLEIAIDQARAYGLLGKNILGTGFDFDVAIKLGAGAFVCGEETALIHSMQGERGEPGPSLPSLPKPACGASRRSSTTWRPSPTSPRSSTKVRIGTRQLGPRRRRARRCSHLRARSTMSAWSRCPWERRCGRSSSRLAAASRAATSTRPLRPAARPGAASPSSSSIRRSTTNRWPGLGRSWARAA